MSSAKAEDYIKAVYQLGDGDEPVAPSAIAEALGVTTPTVTATMKRLADQGLVEREEYKGSHLTEEGELLAIETIRHHRLLELFLTEQLNYDWTEVHDEADRLVAVAKLVECLDVVLGLRARHTTISSV